MKVKFGAIFIALIVLIPIFSIFFEIALGDYSLLEHFFKYLFMRYIQGTFAVAAGVLALSLVIAVVSAWLAATIASRSQNSLNMPSSFRLRFLLIYLAFATSGLWITADIFIKFSALG